MDHEILYGAVAAIIFQNPENGYTVLRFKTQDGEMVTVVGTAGALEMVTVASSVREPQVAVTFTLPACVSLVMESVLPERLTPVGAVPSIAQVTVWPFMGAPYWSLTVAVSSTVSVDCTKVGTLMDLSAATRVVAARLSLVSVRVAVSVLPLQDACTVTVPAAAVLSTVTRPV